jgi:eukaryotic-like serine/threonine-protein kinase
MTHMTQELPIYMNGVVYYGSWDDNFYALRASDGKPAWTYKTSESVYVSPSNSNPATDGKHIVFGMNASKDKGDVWCLDAQSGKLLWTARTNGKSVCSFNSPFVSGGRMYIADLNGWLSCLNIADGKQVWLSQTGDVAYDDSPVVADGKVYIGGLSGGLYCFDERTGAREWAYSTGDGYNFASPTVWRDLVIIPSTDGTVTAVRR